MLKCIDMPHNTNSSIKRQLSKLLTYYVLTLFFKRKKSIRYLKSGYLFFISKESHTSNLSTREVVNFAHMVLR